MIMGWFNCDGYAGTAEASTRASASVGLDSTVLRELRLDLRARGGFHILSLGFSAHGNIASILHVKTARDEAIARLRDARSERKAANKI